MDEMWVRLGEVQLAFRTAKNCDPNAKDAAPASD